MTGEEFLDEALKAWKSLSKDERNEIIFEWYSAVVWDNLSESEKTQAFQDYQNVIRDTANSSFVLEQVKDANALLSKFSKKH